MAARTVVPKAAVQPKAPRARSSTPARALKANEVWPGPKESLTEQAYVQIEEAIVTLQLAPGTIVSELTLSEMTGIGRTPIREAIQRLSREHLILIMPQRGLLVPEIDVKKQLKLLRTRREVERLVCRSAPKSATPQEREECSQLASQVQETPKRKYDVTFVGPRRRLNE